MRKFLSLTGFVLCLTVTGPATMAALDTLDSSVDSDGFFRVNIWRAMLFDTGAAGTTITDVTVDYDQSQQFSDWQFSTMRIYDDTGASGSPGNEIGTFDFDQLDGDLAYFSTSVSPATLNANSSYWLAFTANGANSYFNLTQNPVYTQTLSGYAFTSPTMQSDSFDQGATWSNPSSTSSTPIVALIPEPASLALVGLAMPLLLRRRR